MGPDNESRTNGGGVHREREMRQRKANRVNIGKIVGLEREWVARSREFLSCGEFGGREARWEELGWTLKYGTGLVIKREPGACALVLSHLNFPHITAEYRFQLFKSEQAFFNKGALVNIGPDSRDKGSTDQAWASSHSYHKTVTRNSYCNSLKQTPVSKDRKTKTSGNQTYINVTAVCLANHVLDDLLFLKFP